MKAFLLTLALGTGFAFAAVAETPVTATCKDGTSYSGAHRSGACRGHGGVEAFTSADTPEPKPAPKTVTAAAATPATPAPATASPGPTAYCPVDPGN